MSMARVLCIAPSWLGDCVLARPAVARLGASGFEVDLLVRGRLGRVLEDLPGVQAVHATGSGRAARGRAALRLRGRRYDAALVLPPSFSSALVARLAGARLRVGWGSDRRRALLTLALADPGRDTHLAAQYDDLAAHLGGALGLPAGGTAGDVPAMPALAPRPDEIEAARRLHERLGVADRNTLLVAPGARFGPAKRYPPDRFAAAAAAIAGPRALAIVLVGDDSDLVSTREVAALLPEAIDLAGQTSLAELVGLLALSEGVLANDSGTMHLAAALGRPVVGVFGSSNPRWTRPLGPHTAVVHHPVWCAPCYAPVCRTDFGCMLSLAPERLVEAFSTPPVAALARPSTADRSSGR